MININNKTKIRSAEIHPTKKIPPTKRLLVKGESSIIKLKLINKNRCPRGEYSGITR
jgi:hypothetical protein